MLSIRHFGKWGCALLTLMILACPALAQEPVSAAPGGQPAAGQPPRGTFFVPRQPQRRINDIMPRQEGAKIVPRLLEKATQDNTSVLISLSKQRVWLIVDTEVAIDSPISSGKRGHSTPSGDFRIKEKDLNHASNIYGNYVDRGGRVVRSGVSSRIDSAPSGTYFQGAPMKYFMRLTDGGVGMHIGILPGYAASHGCIRLPADIAPLIYQRVKLGTSVKVEE
jgi:lipoprotein-anchoring transpeptidase ErfK/SrfK